MFLLPLKCSVYYGLIYNLCCRVEERNPKIADYLGLSVTTGLTNYLVSNKEGGENDLIHHVAQEGFLDVITAGPVPPNPSELLLSEKLDSLMARLRENMIM